MEENHVEYNQPQLKTNKNQLQLRIFLLINMEMEIYQRARNLYVKLLRKAYMNRITDNK